MLYSKYLILHSWINHIFDGIDIIHVTLVRKLFRRSREVYQCYIEGWRIIKMLQLSRIHPSSFLKIFDKCIFHSSAFLIGSNLAMDVSFLHIGCSLYLWNSNIYRYVYKVNLFKRLFSFIYNNFKILSISDVWNCVSMSTLRIWSMKYLDCKKDL